MAESRVLAEACVPAESRVLAESCVLAELRVLAESRVLAGEIRAGDRGGARSAVGGSALSG